MRMSAIYPPVRRVERDTLIGGGPLWANLTPGAFHLQPVRPVADRAAAVAGHRAGDR